MRPLTIGLTGGIGSGKSFVSNEFNKLGIEVTDADDISRSITAKNQPALIPIAEHFGNHILDTSGELDRATLRAIIFNNPAEKLWLEQLLHPMIRSKIIDELSQPCSQYRILSSPLLFETKQDELVDYTLTIDCSETLQIERASARDNSSLNLIKSILSSQMPRVLRVDRSDFVLSNEGSKEEIIAEIVKIHHHFLLLASTNKNTSEN